MRDVADLNSLQAILEGATRFPAKPSTSELASLDTRRDTLPRDHFDIRPSAQVMRSWRLADATARDARPEFVAEVREAIDRVLCALDEPKLIVIRPS